MRYLKIYDKSSDYQLLIGGGGVGFIEQPNVSLVDENNSVHYTPVTPVPSNEIWYISTDGNIVTPNEQAKFTDVNGTELSIISNEYKNGRGVIKFDGNLNVIGENSFLNAQTLYKISLPESISSIYGNAFHELLSLKSFNFPSKIKYIYGCITDCYYMENVILPDAAIEIKDYSLWGLTSITELTIPPLVTKIGRSSLRNMPSLKTLIMKPINPPSMAIDDNPLTNTNNIEVIYVPSGSVDAYKDADIWKDYANLIQPMQ